MSSGRAQFDLRGCSPRVDNPSTSSGRKVPSVGAGGVIQHDRLLQGICRDAELLREPRDAIGGHGRNFAADGTLIVGDILELLVADDVADAVVLIEQAVADRLVGAVDGARRFVSEALAVFVHQDAVRKDHYRGLGSAGARVDGLGMKVPVLTGRCRADVERHADAFTLVVVTAARHRAHVDRVSTDVVSHHLRVSLVPAAGEDDGAAPELH